MKVRLVETLGADSILYLQSPDHGDFIMRVEGSAHYQPGQQIAVSPKQGCEHRFSGGRRLEA